MKNLQNKCLTLVQKPERFKYAPRTSKNHAKMRQAGASHAPSSAPVEVSKNAAGFSEVGACNFQG
jgi:hypothetical protein